MKQAHKCRSPFGFAAECSVPVGAGSGLDAGVEVDALPGPAVDFFLALNMSSSMASMSCCSSTSSDQHLSILHIVNAFSIGLQCFDAVGWAAGRATGL